MTPGARRALLPFLLFTCLLGFAGVVRAVPPAGRTDTETTEERGCEADHGALFKWINFVLLAGGLAFVLRKPLSQFFLQRSASIQKSLEEGRKALEKSQAQLRAVEEKLRHFEEAMGEFRAAALREMEEEHARIRRTAAQEAEKMMESIRAQMEVAGKQSRLHLRLFTAQMAVELAEKMLVARLDEPARKQLVREFMTKVEVKQALN